jgi:spermidine synthase
MDVRFLLLLACFFVSGFAALLYQTAWSRELSFVFGTSELAIVAVLAAYMGGLALGAAAAARYAMRLRRPVLAYGILELAIAVCALAVPLGIRGVNALYVGLLGGADALPESGSSAVTLLQLAGAFAVLLPPTALMGATLPLLARHAVHREDEIASRVGTLYAVNTAGAIAGTLCAAFWLMPAVGLRRTEFVGAALNAVVFGLAALLARRAPLATAEADVRPTAMAPGSFWILPAIAVSGTVSFIYEVMWTRLLGHLLGSSVQAFATMLASFLLGIALGSAVAARLAATRERAAFGFSLSQLGIAVMSYAAFAFADSLPDLSKRLGAGPGDPLASALVAGAVLLPITLSIGATFPFAVRVLARDAEHTASATARLYSWNTVGAIAGALGAGFFLLPGLGFQGTLTVGVVVSLALAVLAALASTPRRFVPVAVAAAAAVVLALVPPRVPWRVLTSSPLAADARNAEIVYSAVGRTSTVMLLAWKTRYQVLTDGLPESFIDPVGSLPEINVAQWLGALPGMIRPEARDVLVVGFGGGMALERMPKSYESVDVIEIEPEVVEANRRVSARRAIDPLADPRVHVHIGDARGSLQLSGKRYDAIVSQPSHPWTAGASHLYTREFFSLVRSKLKPDGVFVQWIGISFVDDALLRSLLSALVEAFPHVELFQPQVHGLLFVASGEPIDALAGAARGLAQHPDDFARLGMHRLEDFASAWVLDDAGVRAVAHGAPPNSDDLNFLAARSARLGKDQLDGDSLRTMLKRGDPLARATQLDRAALIRALANRRMTNRATDLALAADGAAEESALGWIELAGRRLPRAARFFERALSLSPGDPDAEAGLIVSRMGELGSGRELPALSGRELPAGHTAVIAALRAARAGDWDGVAAHESELAAIPPGDPLYELAARLRTNRLLASGKPEDAAEAQAITEALLLRVWHPDDLLVRAQAAIAAGRPGDAKASLHMLATQVTTTSYGVALASEILKLARKLPEDDYLAIEAQMRPGRSRPAGDGDGNPDAPVRDETAAPGNE